MKPKKIVLVVGARPNFMKAAPVLSALERHPEAFDPLLVHTGQHYDYELSKAFFDDLELPEPQVYLGVGSGLHGVQTARIMVAMEEVFLKESPDLLMVFGDVNSTMAASITAAKLHIPTAHVEAGLRSFDRTMPEEINRIVTDVLSDYLFITCEDARENLSREGVPDEKIFFTGNVMIDSLHRYREKAERSVVLEELDLEKGNYVVLTLHRPSNVDERDVLSGLLDALCAISQELPVVFPAHPRTRKKLEEFKLTGRLDSCAGKPGSRTGLQLIEPRSYTDFLALEMNAKLALTDSGGIQEETTVLGIPCLTLRANTERPVTITRGTNRLVGNEADDIVREARKILAGERKEGEIPPLWDGESAERIVRVLLQEGRSP
jgi:UDP-N-acetylglucosamine 2-epimerase (non-hydrolysing)